MSTPWMAGTVVSYDSGTKTLILNVTASNGSGTITSWYVAVGRLPGKPINTLDTSTSSVAVGTGSKTFITATALTLVPGQNVIVSNEELPSDQSTISRLQPKYLDDDEHDDSLWWDSEYRYYGESGQVASTKPRTFKIFGTSLYVNPKVSGPVIISGAYNAKPASLSAMTDAIPWNGLFDEIFREGVVRIVLKGITIPDADPDFVLFFNREFHTVLNSRARLVRNIHRLNRSNYM